ncbi:hypothetical protein HAQ06_24245 [Pseudomonas sp. C2L12B]|uniref:Uncharacterized protein n=1 Tax=Pseudomonas typographi TaxID=2715964 RepID=A0ABR7Z941_9PSED|nr:hypothetical protein [Pseudomonas typographi]MBD1589744.1 hypothetical protein [Pseudomonas typographi]MBD1601952.1 hypothetical protein [Pseudomonas typographi]
MQVHITNGRQNGVANISMGIGKYPTPSDIADRIAAFEHDELPGAAPGFRLQTPQEFWDTACLDRIGGKLACPPTWQAWKPLD